MKLISLGSNCMIAQWLKERGLREESSPFDWLVTSMSYLINVFSTDNLEFTNIEKLYRNDRRIYNSDYLACSTHDAEPCRNATDEEFSVYIPEINEKFRRRFTRLYNTLNGGLDVTFIRVVLDTGGDVIISPPKKNLKIIYIY